MCISGFCLFCLYDISERQLHNNNARGINIQLHAHQLHINNCWGINCVIIPAPMVRSLIRNGHKGAGTCWEVLRTVPPLSVTPLPLSGKSHPWTNTSVGGNFRRTFRIIGPYEFPQEKVWTNDWSIWISPEIRMDQWRSKFSESFGLGRYWSIECSSLPL